MTTETKAPNYRIYDRTGGGVTEDIYAESLEDAIRQGREWIEAGDWSECGSDEGDTYHTIALECEVGEIVYSTGLIRIEYLDEDENVIATHDTDDDATMEEIAEWEAWMSDSAVEHPDEPEGGWDSYRLVTYTPEGYTPVIDEDATHDAARHDCSGVYCDELPDCEAQPDVNKLPDDLDKSDIDEQGHLWRSPYKLVGGIRDNPGVWSNGGTRMTLRHVCAFCGCYHTETTAGSQHNPGEPLESVKIEPRDADSEAWLRELHEDDGYLPEWLAELLDAEDATRQQVASKVRDFAVDEAQDVSQGIYDSAIKLADEIEAGEHTRAEADEMLGSLRSDLEESEANA